MDVQLMQENKMRREVVYRKKVVPPKVIALLWAGVLVFSFAAAAGVTISHIVRI